MFFYATKALWLAAVPSTALLLLAAIGIGLAARGRRAGLALAGIAVATGLLVGLGPVGTLLLLPLEDRFPPYQEDGRPIAGIIVLGGGIYTEISAARGQLSLGEAAERYIAMSDLARRHPEADIVFSGGSGTLLGEDASEAAVIRRFEGVLGIPPGRVRYEGSSRTTWENARETRRLVAPKPGERWLLATSARHMARAMGCFRQVGIDATAYPVDYLTTGSPDLLSPQPAAAIGLQRFDDGAKEWVGLLAYRMSGRSPELFPAPR